MKYRIRTAAIILAFYLQSGSSYADMPDCLSGVCEGDVYSNQELSNKGFVLDRQNLCETRSWYNKEIDNIRLEIIVSDSSNEGQKIGEIVKIRRVIYISAQKTMEEDFKSILRSIRTKYGTPRKEFGSEKLFDIKYRYNSPKKGTQYSGREVSVFIPNLNTTHKYFVIDEEIENRLYHDYYLNQFSECRDIELKNEARKTIPD